MAIKGISSLVLGNISKYNPEKKDNTIVKEHVAVSKPLSNSGMALRSYFFGGKSVSFGFRCSTGDFVTKEIEDVPCCCCGGRMPLNSELTAEKISSKSGRDLADALRTNRDYFRNNQGTIAMMIADEAEKSNCDASRAAKKIKPDFINKLKNYCNNVLNETSQIAKNTMGKNNPVSQIIEREKQNIAKGRIDRVQFTEKIVSLYKSGKIDDESYDKIINSAMHMPLTTEAVHKEFMRVQSGSSRGIIGNLMAESEQTIEHIHPHSKGGKNDTDNYIAECGECNHGRGSMPYSKWLKVHPEYPVNVQKHIEWFQQQIVDGKINSEYDDYGTKVKDTLFKESGGEMVLKVLDKNKINELRERASKGEEINVHEEIKKQEQEKKTK